MMRMIKIFPFTICLFWTTESLTQDNLQADEGRLFVLGFNTTLDLYALDERQEGVTPTSRTELNMVSENISIALAADLSHIFETYRLNLNDDFDWERFITQASLQIQDIGGEPVALILGKHTIPFGQGYTRMPLPFFWNNSAASMQEIQGVLGMSVKVSELSNFQSLLDEVEMSIFESSSTWDFNIEGKPAYSMRITKTIETDDYEHKITSSYTKIDNDHLNLPPFLKIGRYQERISLGLITEPTFSDELLLWWEGIYFENHPLYPSPSRFLLSMGGSYQMTEKLFANGEFNTMESHHRSYAGALWYRLISVESRQLSLGLEYRYTDFKNDTLLKDDHMVGILMRLQFYTAKGFRLRNK